jgi:hypothetical protein
VPFGRKYDLFYCYLSRCSLKPCGFLALTFEAYRSRNSSIKHTRRYSSSYELAHISRTKRQLMWAMAIRGDMKSAASLILRPNKANQRHMCTEFHGDVIRIPCLVSWNTNTQRPVYPRAIHSLRSATYHSFTARSTARWPRHLKRSIKALHAVVSLHNAAYQ